MADMKITEYNSHNAPATGDQFFMIGASEEYRIDYDALASAILDKLTTKTYSGLNNNTVIGALQATTYTTVLSSTTYGDKAAVLAALDAYADSIGNKSRIVGYISTQNSGLLGLTSTSHYFDYYVNSAGFRLLVAYPVNGSNIYLLAKQNSTWASSWTKLQKLAWTADSEVKITTSLQEHVAGLGNGSHYAWSATADYTAVGAPSENSYHYMITKVNSSTAIILAYRMTTGATSRYTKQLYGGNWGEWVAING